MKYIIVPAILIMMALASCKKHTPSGGSSTICYCHTDTTNKTYGVAPNYFAADTALYNDSCNTVKLQNNWDTCVVRVIAL